MQTRLQTEQKLEQVEVSQCEAVFRKLSYTTPTLSVAENQPLGKEKQQEKVLIGDVITIISQSRFSRVLDEGKIDRDGEGAPPPKKKSRHSNDILNRPAKRDATVSVHLFFLRPFA